MEQILYKKSKVDELLNSDTLFYEEITYSALKQKRDNSQLIKGKMYRITDYQCTTTQFDTQSANHQFDIIVVATEKNVLNENAKAVQHDGDTYFSDSDLNAWEIKYCLDNDLSRFAWADSENGKGVIFYMKDEFNNECPYDFKNIQFKRYKISADNSRNSVLSDLVGQYLGFKNAYLHNLSRASNDFIWCYTFTKYKEDFSGILDTSLNIIPSVSISLSSVSFRCERNIIKELTVVSSNDDDDAVFKQCLNDICLSHFYDDKTYYSSYGEPYDNFFGGNCRYISLISANRNCFGNRCVEICASKFENNTLGDGCESNSFGNNCRKNIFGKDVASTDFGNECTTNSLGDGSYGNNFGKTSFRNTLGKSCISNTFGTNCHSNTLGIACNNNTLGNYCAYNTFFNGSNGNKIDPYGQYNIFENDVYRVELKASTSGGSSKILQHIKISQGVRNKIITETRELEYQVVYKASGSLEKEV